MIEWTTAPPSLPGYYWCATPSWADGVPRLIEFAHNSYNGRLYTASGCHAAPDDVMFRRSLWIGPLDLTPPAKPRADLQATVDTLRPESRGD